MKKNTLLNASLNTVARYGFKPDAVVYAATIRILLENGLLSVVWQIDRHTAKLKNSPTLHNNFAHSTCYAIH